MPTHEREDVYAVIDRVNKVSDPNWSQSDEAKGIGSVANALLQRHRDRQLKVEQWARRLQMAVAIAAVLVLAAAAKWTVQELL